MKTYIKEKAVAERFGISVHTLQKNRQLRKGLPFYKIGSSVFYCLEEIEAYIQSMRVAGGENVKPS